MKNVAAIVLAGGKGVRIGSELPKVLNPVMGKPLVFYTLDNLKKSGMDQILVVIGFRGEDVKGCIGESVRYVFQKEQLGTANALECALPELSPSIEQALVLNGDDSAFYHPLTLKNFVKEHILKKSLISLLTLNVENPVGFGRIKRDKEGNIEKIIEEKDLVGDEKNISEINTGCYVFDTSWLSESINKINLSSSGEYYLTSMVELAYKKGVKVNSFKLVKDSEWIGVNTKEELALANEKMHLRLKRQLEPKAIILDSENVLINTDMIKSGLMDRVVNKLANSYNLTTSKEVLRKKYLESYSAVKEKFGHVSIPKICDELIKSLELNISSTGLKNIFYSFPFEKYRRPGMLEFLGHTKRLVRLVLFTKGETVYEPIKLQQSGILSVMDDYYIFEKTVGNVKSICDLYKSYSKIIIFTAPEVLMEFKKSDPTAISVWMKFGSHSKTKIAGLFHPDYTVKNLNQLLQLVKDLLAS